MELTLSEASYQEIQLELVRRCRMNFLDGSKVAASLLTHRDLWLAAYLDRFGHDAMIKLRDLPRDDWNVDTLFVLTKTLDQAKQLAAVAEEEDWQADDIVVYENCNELSAMLGSYPADCHVVTFWWD